MSDEERPVTETNNGNTSGFANPLVVYVLYLVSVVFGVTAIAGVVFAYLAEPADSMEKSHYQYQIRTFWIGLLYFLVGAVLTVVVIGVAVLIFTLVWWLVRCIKGLILFDKKQPIPDPQTWLW